MANCTAAFLVGGTGKRKNGKNAVKILGSEYNIQVRFTGDSKLWTTQKKYIYNIHLVGIADTTGSGCWDSLSQYILL